MSVGVKGAETVLRNLKLQIEKMQKYSDDAVDDAARSIAFESTNQVPFDKGTLKNTLRIEKTKEGVRVISYNTPYAVRLHENPQYNFKNGRKGKYLEDPLKQNKDTARNIFKAKLKVK